MPIQGLLPCRLVERQLFSYTRLVARHNNSSSYEDAVASLTTAKALAIGIYGESVASYRYRVLSEKLPDPDQKTAFLEMANEEQGHHRLLQTLLRKHFPGSDFVLTHEDKELVTVGPRMLDVSNESSVKSALKMIHDSEMLTGRFYEAFHQSTPSHAIKSILKEMADECFEHAARLLKPYPMP